MKCETCEELQARIAELEAKYAQMYQDRYDALSVESSDGLLSSEWILRTGKAERERDELKRQIEAVRKLEKFQVPLAPDGYMAVWADELEGIMGVIYD